MAMNRKTLVIGLVPTMAIGVISWGEWCTWRASLDVVPGGGCESPISDHREFILVPGFPSRDDGRASLVQKWRCRIAVRSMSSSAAMFVFSGGPSRGGLSEAAVMSAYAVGRLGVPEDSVVLEEESRNTWENVTRSVRFLEDAESIVIASNTFHARRVRNYLQKQRPDLALLLRRGRDWLPGEFAPIKPVLVFYEWRRARQARTRGWN